MSKSNSDNNFLQPIFSTLGLVVSLVSAAAPLFAQAQLSSFFIDAQMALPASVVSIILGVLLSWHFINIHGNINIPFGIKKDRGNGYNQPPLYINNRNIIVIILPLLIASFFGFFMLNNLEGHIIGITQATLYILFFTILIGSFSLFIANTKSAYEYEQTQTNVGNIVYETLERNGTVKSGIDVIQNTQVTNRQELMDLGMNFNDCFLARRLLVKTIKQEEKLYTVYISPDYKRIFTVVLNEDTSSKKGSAK